MKALKSTVPVCSQCRALLDDDSFWQLLHSLQKQCNTNYDNHLFCNFCTHTEQLIKVTIRYICARTVDCNQC